MNGRQWISDNWRWIGPLVGALGSGMLAVLVMLLTASTGEDRAANDIIADWNRTISKLGIEPVFPPEEDIYVGDIFAVVKADHLDTNARSTPAGSNFISTLSNPLLNRAVKVDHVDMTQTLKEFYSQLPVFSTTTPRPPADRDIWAQAAADDVDPFTASPHKYLSLAAFPAFTIKTSNAGSGDLQIPMIGRLSFSRSRKDSEELEIVFAETYGVPTVLAAAILAKYCQDPFTRSVCDEERVRDHLTFLMGSAVKELLPNSKDYRFEVELHFVYRAYLTRAINRRLDAIVTKEASSERATLPVAPSVAGSAPQAPQSTTAPGVSASGATQSDRESSLDRAFQRPIVFGYRAVKKTFTGEDK